MNAAIRHPEWKIGALSPRPPVALIKKRPPLLVLESFGSQSPTTAPHGARRQQKMLKSAAFRWASCSAF